MNKQIAIKTPEKATYADVLAAPENMVAEVMQGSLYLQPRPLLRHSLAGSSLGIEIGSPFGKGRGGPGGWWILDEPEIHLGEDILVPDIGGWRRENWPEGPRGAYATVAPDWVCEILSPSTRTYDLTVKRDIYGANGVGHLWFVDPDAKTLEAFALEGGSWVLISALAGDADVRVAPFDAISFSLAELWVPEPDEET